MTPTGTATGANLGARTGKPSISWGKEKHGHRPFQFQQFTPEQMNLFQSLFGHLGPEGFLSKLAGGDESAFHQMEQPGWRALNQAQGGLASRFSGMGSGALKSSGARNTMSALGSQFAENLMANRMNVRNQALRDLMGMSDMLLGQRPYQQGIMQEQKKPSFWESLLGGLGSLGGLGLGAFGGSYLGGLGQRLSGLGQEGQSAEQRGIEHRFMG